MTTLFVTPINMAEPGSWAKRKRALHAYSDLRKAMEGRDPTALVEAFDRVEEAVKENLRTDDGTPIGDALEQISANDFDAFMGGLLSKAETIPNPTSAPSP